MPLDRFESWLCLHHPYLVGISREALLTITAVVVLLGLLATIRRRDKALILLHSGLLTVLLVYPVSLFGMLWSLQFNRPDRPFIDFAMAMHPFYTFRSIATNFLQPIGCLVGLVGGLTALRRPHRTME